MAKPSRQLAGKRAKDAGFTWELIFKRTALRERVHVERMPDGCKTIGKFKIIRVKTPFDYVIAFSGKSAFIDCKTFEHDGLRYSDIKFHQLESLYNLGWHAPAGYVVWSRNKNEVRFYPWNHMVKLKPRQSLAIEDGLCLGGIERFSVKEIFRTYRPGFYDEQTLEQDLALWKVNS